MSFFTLLAWFILFLYFSHRIWVRPCLKYLLRAMDFLWQAFRREALMNGTGLATGFLRFNGACSLMMSSIRDLLYQNLSSKSSVNTYHRSLVNYPHKDQWCRALMFSLICGWINGWVNNREADDLTRHRAHYDVTVMGWCGCDCGDWYRRNNSRVDYTAHKNATVWPCCILVQKTRKYLVWTNCKLLIQIKPDQSQRIRGLD